MKTLKFKTNINCASCMATAKPYLDSVKFIQGWEVDTKDPEKILTVKGDNVEAENVMNMVQQAGYKIEPKKTGLRSIFG